MKKPFVILLLFALAGCGQKSQDERIVDIVKAIQENWIDEFQDRKRTFVFPKIMYVRSVELFNVHIHYFHSYTSHSFPRIPRIIIVMETPTKEIKIVSKAEDIIKYMKPFNEVQFNDSFSIDLYTTEYNNLLRQVIEFHKLMTIDSRGRERGEIIINTPDDIPEIREKDRQQLTAIGFHPLNKKVFNDRLEVNYFSWDYFDLTLYECKLILTQNVRWERKIVRSKIGPANMYNLPR